jgi:hypothetical protein
MNVVNGMKMNKFKFFSGIRIQYILITTRDTNTTYSIPLDMYGHILQLGVDLYRNNLALFDYFEYRIENEIGVGITYLYKVDFVTSNSMSPDRIRIEYSIRFPGTEYYCEFVTEENISLYD